MHRLPLLGEIAAGGPLLAEQNVEDYVAVPEPLARGGEEFLLRVKGDSMINAGILDGDSSSCAASRTRADGDIVVALAGDDETADEATVKRFFRENGRIRLQPENDALEPIYADHVAGAGQGDGGVQGAMSTVEPFNRTLDQELNALAARREPRMPRVRRVRPAPARTGSPAPSAARSYGEAAQPRLQLTRRPGDRGPFGARGKSGHRRAGRWGDPGGESRRKVAQKGDRRQRFSETLKVRVKRWGKSPPAPWRHGG